MTDNERTVFEMADLSEVIQGGFGGFLQYHIINATEFVISKNKFLEVALKLELNCLIHAVKRFLHVLSPFVFCHGSSEGNCGSGCQG